jgi:predicted RNase H-like nuclease
MVKFAGIDLGWSSGASGLCCLSWQTDHLVLVDLQIQAEISQVLAWVEAQFSPQEAGVIAVDAPTVIPNQTGMRLCDRLTHRYFGRYHAGSYPANLSRPFAQRTVGLGQSLEAMGFRHLPEAGPQPLGRYQLEVFPHPATVQLFNLNRILKYKKGPVAERQVALNQLRQLIHQTLPQLTPSVDWSAGSLPLPDIPTGGRALKAVEDQLDSLICAYVAAHWWYWGAERNWVLGDRQQGYIVVPAPNGPSGCPEG